MKAIQNTELTNELQLHTDYKISIFYCAKLIPK